MRHRFVLVAAPAVAALLLMSTLAACGARGGGAPPAPRVQVVVSDVDPAAARPTARQQQAASPVALTVRGHARELESCFQDALRAESTLAGDIAIAVTIDTRGTATRASVSERTWSGAAATAAEACMLRKLRTWLFPSGAPGAYTVRLQLRKA